MSIGFIPEKNEARTPTPMDGFDHSSVLDFTDPIPRRKDKITREPSADRPHSSLRNQARGELTMSTISPRHILVVEDDADARENLTDILEMDGWTVDAVATASEALNRDDWSGYSALLVDRKLPDGDSVDLLPHFQQLASQASIIVITGCSDLDGAISALRRGAVDYILKPINPEVLRASLRHVADLRRVTEERNHAEKRARQAERLAAVGQAMAGVVHESRNALQRAKACLEMLALEVEDRPEALDLIAGVQRAQADLQRLHAEVGDYAAPMQLEFARSNLATLWRQTWSQLTPLWKDRSIVLRETIDCDPTGEVDAFRLNQVFRNIFENAIQASLAQGAILVRCESDVLDGRAALRCSVRDKGPGMNQQQRAQIFEPFFTTKVKGTGLGMAIAQRIVDSHGGTIEVADHDGPGAEIIITLPIMQA